MFFHSPIANIKWSRLCRLPLTNHSFLGQLALGWIDMTIQRNRHSQQSDLPAGNSLVGIPKAPEKGTNRLLNLRFIKGMSFNFWRCPKDLWIEISSNYVNHVFFSFYNYFEDSYIVSSSVIFSYGEMYYVCLPKLTTTFNNSLRCCHKVYTSWSLVANSQNEIVLLLSFRSQIYV